MEATETVHRAVPAGVVVGLLLPAEHGATQAHQDRGSAEEADHHQDSICYEGTSLPYSMWGRDSSVG